MLRKTKLTAGHESSKSRHLLVVRIYIYIYIYIYRERERIDENKQIVLNTSVTQKMLQCWSTELDKKDDLFTRDFNTKSLTYQQGKKSSDETSILTEISSDDSLLIQLELYKAPTASLQKGKTPQRVS